MGKLPLCAMGPDIVLPILSEWLELEEFVHFDSSMCNIDGRKALLECVSSFHHAFEKYFKNLSVHLSIYMLDWMVQRRLSLESISCVELSHGTPRHLRTHHDALLQLEPDLSALTTVEISNVSEREAMLQIGAFLGSLTSLRSLTVNDCMYVGFICDFVRSGQLRRLALRYGGDVTDENLSELLERETQLEELSIFQCSGITTAALAALQRPLSVFEFHCDEETPATALLPFCRPGLKKCDFPEFPDLLLNHLEEHCASSLTCLTLPTSVGERAALSLASACAALACVNIATSIALDDSFVFALAEHNRQLRCVDFTDVYSVSDESLSVLFRNCPLLEEVRLGRNDVSGECYALIPTHCPRLHTLECDKISREVLAEVMERCPSLTSLTLDCCDNDVVEALYSRGHRLRTLSLQCFFEKESLCRLFVASPSLTDLNCIGMDERCLLALIHSCRLRHLSWSFSIGVLARSTLDEVVRTQHRTLRLLRVYYGASKKEVEYLTSRMPRVQWSH